MEIFTALADPTRRRIVELLSRGECAAGEIVEAFDVSGPAISQHLKVLREAALVQVRIEGQRRIYQLNPQGLSEMDAWLNDVRRFWAPRLDALERELLKPERKPKAKRSRR
ncbi:winged helix-turn-helix transcriptional regulator [Ferrovibrio terrae]|uniref:Winged helix-turn-helix transcriptional regulator n=1 Tax=Ferrovibrio terrae TaxID=2594003 RepID=A0A516H0F4_9PROT|nr:metalloregulator ArsR/SmtB family transcription factor [Ferrovibrio terrae]QDO97254.1 winged helix-turn-helix transcriptional regulator [Ferrovibrio terrae]